ncbi:peptidase S8/S53 domain-containing protein [Xylariales sp. PMI_506]|nr:peptidase S8/S53 domain-containing protein [Xylariales sp. PMI_506]
MIANTILPAILALASGSIAVPAARSPKSVFESMAKPQSGWAADAIQAFSKEDTEIQLKIQLVHQNMDTFYQRALDIATPSHALYGQFMTREDIDAIIAPSQESHDLVMDWLVSEGLGEVSSLNSRGNVILVNTTISKAESLLNADYKSYTDSTNGNTAIRTLEFSVPENLAEHIKQVQPTTFFGFRPYKGTRKPLSQVANGTAIDVGACTTLSTPACIAALYGAYDITLPTGGLMGITGFTNQVPSKTDLATFLKDYAFNNNAAYSYTCVSVDSGLCTIAAAEAGDEANLDVQYSRAIIGDIPMAFYSTGGETNNIFELLGEYLLELPAASLPQTISISYGEPEADLTTALMTATCDVFAQVGALGVSIMIASGDSGVGTACGTSYKPDFPASCPYVTAVGGLQGLTTAAAEEVWTDGGGGFSTIFTQPTYQTTAVTKWLATNTDGKTAYYNKAGRGYPDVSAGAVDFPIVVDARVEAVDGTSCASPTFASIIQIINSNRIAAGKSGLGFLNPFLYENPTALVDITLGGNTGCTILGGGFSAIAGWDPASGLGAANYAALNTASNAN